MSPLDVESLRNEKEYSRSAVLGDDSPASSKGLSRYAAHQTPDAAPYSTIRKTLIMIILCSAQFFNIFNASSAIVTSPMLREHLNISSGTLSWVISGYNLTFVAFVLASVSLADTFRPKPVLCTGYAIVGLFSIPISTSVHPIMTMVFRAVQGVGAALNILAALSVIITLFPNSTIQRRAILTYSTFTCFGNALGLILGDVITTRASWNRVYHITATVIVLFAALSWFFLPDYTNPMRGSRRNVDWPGVGTLTAGLILLVYAISDGGDTGWGSAHVTATHIVSAVLFFLPFVIEGVVRDLVSRTWADKKFTPLFCYAWSFYWFLFANNLVFTEFWHVSTFSASTRFIPLGVSCGMAAYLAALLGPRIVRYILLVSKHVLFGVGAALLARTDKLETYWSSVFPRMIPAVYAK